MEILKGRFTEGDTIDIDMRGAKITFRRRAGQPQLPAGVPAALAGAAPRALPAPSAVQVPPSEESVEAKTGESAHVNRRALPLALALLLVSVLLCADPASDLLVSGRKAFANAQYGLAARTLRRILEEFPESSKSEEAAYLLGVAQFLTGSYPESAATLAGLRSRAPRSPFAARAGYWLGAATLRLGRVEKALEILRAEAARTDAEAVYKPHAMLLAGTALEERAGHRGCVPVPGAAWRPTRRCERRRARQPARRGDAQARGNGLPGRPLGSGARRVCPRAPGVPRSPLVRDALFFVGECERALGNLSGAEKRYRSLLSLYADSPWRDAATCVSPRSQPARAGRRKPCSR